MNHLLTEFVLLQVAYPHLAFVFLSLVKSSLVISLTWAAVFILRSRSALARSWVWRCAFIGLLGVAFWEFAPTPLTSLHPIWHVSPTAEESATFAQSIYGQPIRATPETVVSAQATEPPTKPQANPMVSLLEDNLEAVWYGGIIVFVVWQLIRTLAGLWWLKKSALPVSPDLQREAGRISVAHGLGNAPRLAVCRELTTPLLIGWVKPSVFLPEENSRWDTQKLEAVLLHELTHWKRRDGWWQALAALTGSIWWWNPLAWFAIRRLKMEAEQAADDMVVLRQHDAPSYAQALIDIAASTTQESFSVGIAMVGQSSLELRVRAILHENPWRGKLGKLGFGAAAFLTCLFLSLGGFYLSAETDRTRSDSSGTVNITGTVLDKSGQPVPHAEVRVQGLEWRKGVTNYSPGSPDPSLDFKKIGTCDDKGEFAIKNVSHDYLFTCVAVAPGYGPEFAKNIDPKLGGVKIALVKLDPSQEGGMARGHVVDGTGKPIAGAQVRPETFTVWGTTTNYPGRQVQNTVTDQDGNFSIPPAPPYQGVNVLVIAPGVARKYFTLIPYNNQPHDLVMEKGITVTGRLVKDGKPLPHIQVGIAQTNNPILDEITASTDADGQFALKDVAANNEYEVYAKRDSLGMIGVPQRKIIEIGESGTTVPIGDISVVEGHKITGQITLSGGKTLALGRPVQLHVYRAGTSDDQYIDLASDLKFELEVRDKETLSLSAWIPGYRLAAPNEQQSVNVTPDLKPIDMKFVPDQKPASKMDASAIKTTTLTITPIPPAGVEWEKIAIQLNGSYPWTLSPDGRSLTAQISSPNNYGLRAVCRTRTGQLYFSEPQYVQVTASDDSIHLDLHTFFPAFQVKGSLDASVPRPVKDGMVIACVTTANPDYTTGWLTWNSTATIRSDGTFEISNLPRPEGLPKHPDSVTPPMLGELELIATCDGAVSKDPATKRTEYCVGPQIFSPPISQPVTLVMEPLGSARVRVLDPQGKPLAGAIVVFSPNESFRWISTLLGSPMDNENELFNENKGNPTTWQKLTERYRATTDETGFAVVDKLPSGLEPYVVINTPYDMPFRRRLDQSSTKYAQNGIVTVAAGAQVAAEMRLIPKMESIAIPNSISLDGKYVVSVEANQPGYDPQAIVIRNAKTHEQIVATRLPYNADHQVDLVSASDKVKVEWDPGSSFFIFSVWRTDHLDMLAVSVENKPPTGYATTDLSLPYAGSFKVLSYKFVAERTIRLTLGTGPGKAQFAYATVFKNGIVHGGSQPPAPPVNNGQPN
jgi:beta-lactamase regulating signal transducer with metallopeptidase domain/uncharacterized GH25 family protein